ncbi:hypothetical protein A7U60_g1297 [Sanghuangporus baumii]|uniref:Uncharacterized protein n=1 Tax=Sanghuangporus baumii TaxID=108892 RepID=A0A9Q5I4A9_SANBA|nr:hypothetical protein A7U60_g1297 [Sanghuangporus baumii]
MRAKSMHAGYTCIHFRDQFPNSQKQYHIFPRLRGSNAALDRLRTISIRRSQEAPRHGRSLFKFLLLRIQGVDVPGAVKRDGFYRGYFLVVFFKPLSDEETIEKFEPIPFDSTDADMKRILESLAKYDCKEQEMEGRWKTFSEWSFVEHIEPKVDG